MKCLICGNESLETVDTIVSDFVMDRITDNYIAGNNRKTRICNCTNCSFSFYEYRMTDEEQEKLYKNYRDEEYQKIREKYECWYTQKVNYALNNDSKALSEQKRVIEKMLDENSICDIDCVLDWGGNEGKTITDRMGKNKYVYDISGIPTVDGVIGLSSTESIFQNSYDFIMCNMLFEHLSYPVDFLNQLKEYGKKGTVYYIEVPSENPFEKNKFSILKNLQLFANRTYSKTRLMKYYFQRRSLPFMPMSEHINFFTVDSIRTMVEKCGFKVIDVQENYEEGVLGKNKVLSILFKQ